MFDLLTFFAALYCDWAVRGTVLCCFFITYFTRPEQSKAVGPEAPRRYGLPFWSFAMCSVAVALTLGVVVEELELAEVEARAGVSADESDHETGIMTPSAR